MLTRESFGNIIKNIKDIYTRRCVNPTIKQMVFVVDGKNEMEDTENLFALMSLITRNVKSSMGLELIEWWLDSESEKIILEEGEIVVELYNREQLYRYLVKNDMIKGIN